MAFKLEISISDDGLVDVSHEGKMSSIVILGALRRLEHDLLMTTTLMEAQATLGQDKENKDAAAAKSDS